MKSPEKKPSALIIGAGSIGERHLRCFQATGQFTVSACELNDALRQSIHEKYQCPVHTSLDEALALGGFDLAVICTLANSHIPIASECVRHGLHVLIEKPLAVSLDGIEEFAKLAEEKQRTVRIAYVTRALHAVIRLKALLDEGVIGQPRHISVVAGQHFPTFRPAYRTIYYNKHETGGGAIQDALTHQLHTVEWLVGPIRSISASAAHQVLEGVEVEDTVNATAVLQCGALAGFAYNQFQAPAEVTIQINGERGSVRSEQHNHRIGIFRHGDSGWTWMDQNAEDRDAPFIRQALFFADAIAGKPSPLATLADGFQTLKANRAALESVRTHREVTID